MATEPIELTGKVVNGVIVLENGGTLPDGTLVRVEPVTSWKLAESENELGQLREMLLSHGGVIAPEQRLFDHGIDLYRKRPDKSWSLTDCISFVVMEQEEVTEALSGDHHFEQAGFKALMR